MFKCEKKLQERFNLKDNISIVDIVDLKDKMALCPLGSIHLNEENTDYCVTDDD